MDVENMTNKDIWQMIESKAEKHPAYLEQLDAVYGVQFTGEVPASYRIEVKDCKLDIETREATDADCTLILSFKSFKKLLQGNLNTTAAFMTGKLKVKGNIGLAMKLEKTLKQFSF